MDGQNLKKLCSKDFLIFIVATFIFVFAYQALFVETTRPVADALRYIDYAINLHEHGTFGLTGARHRGDVQPGNENTPLLPALIAMAMRVDADLHQALSCFLSSADKASCHLGGNAFIWVQCFLVVLALGSIWLTTMVLTHSRAVSWAAAAVALYSGEFIYYANLFLTETLTLFLFCVLTLVLALILKTRQLRWQVVLGFIVGLLTLTRPEYHYLFLALVCTGLMVLLVKRRVIGLRFVVVIVLSYYVVLGPWLLRNHRYFNDYAVTQTYAGAVLAQRLAYNQMSWTEWSVAFLYWFPDFGDNLTKRLFPRDYYQMLSFEPVSYYQQGSLAVMKRARAKAESADEILSYLLNELIEHPVKHSLVTLPLAWRGMFIAKYWGVLGVLCFGFLLFRTGNPTYRQVILLSAPAWFLELLHAFVSVNVPRYNIMLIPTYSISIALVLSLCYAHMAYRINRSS